jgi:hypothetical protein
MSDAEPRSEAPPNESPPLAARIGLIAGPIAAMTVFFLLPGGDGGLTHAARACGGVATLMAVWWMTEALPLEATALLPLVLLPLTGVYSADIRVGDVVTVKPLQATGRVDELLQDQALVRFVHATGMSGAYYPLAELSKEQPFKRAASSFADPAIFRCAPSAVRPRQRRSCRPAEDSETPSLACPAARLSYESPQTTSIWWLESHTQGIRSAVLPWSCLVR